MFRESERNMHRWLVWNLIFPLQERMKSHATLSILKDMEAADRLSVEDLSALQNAKLRELIEYCYVHVPHIRASMQTGRLTPADIRGRDDLHRLPVMTKSDIRRARESLRSDIAAKLAPFTTGGSTGEPLIFDLAKRRVAARVACRQRVSRWWGVSVGDPEIALWGSPVELTRQDRIRVLRDKLLATRLLSAFEMNASTMTKYLDIIEAGKWRQMFGYPSAVYLLCRHAQQQGRNLRKAGLRAVFVTGEVLLPYQRKVITETLDCPVADGYGGRDSGFISHECPHGSMHILSDAVIVELLDNDRRPVPVGEPGEIVVTDLYSHEFPFVRYATGDMAVLSKSSCGCGRPLPVLERIEGRSNDLIVAADGRMINSLALVYLVREVEGIGEFRICQKQIDNFHVQIVRSNSYPESGENHIRRGWEKLLRCPLRVTFEYLPALPRERSGKFRHVVSELGEGRFQRT